MPTTGHPASKLSCSASGPWSSSAWYPTVEEMIVAAPAVVAEKSRASFEENWQRLTGPTLWDGAGGH